MIFLPFDSERVEHNRNERLCRGCYRVIALVAAPKMSTSDRPSMRNAMIAAIEISAAISAYSMAVAPLGLARRRRRVGIGGTPTRYACAKSCAAGLPKRYLFWFTRANAVSG